jgi:acyl-CoA synthetase (AMP-forming)/AMP-acid ligase II
MMMTKPGTILELLAAGEESKNAIEAPGRKPLSYQALRAHVVETVDRLNALGVGRNDPVAIVLPNGPAMASSFVSVASAATAAPLNPAYREEELEFYLGDLNAKLLLLDRESGALARKVAERLGIPVAEIEETPDDPAGCFGIWGAESRARAPLPGPARVEDVALVLHTSGTTSRPKIVPLTHQNVCASALNVAESLSLLSSDRCLNVMPLFHIHGLIAAVLASLSAGASVCCTPGFNALKFFAWIDEARPTWYTAVPTMHQAILARADRNRDTIARNPLRFLRSSSASLPPQVMTALEETFGAPVIEAYGMTEAAHQMAANPLPPRPRKAGSVGIAAGPEVAVMDEAGNLLPPEVTGEVVIRGPNVTLGYQNNPSANASAFTRGWFRTGDQGVLDHEGYLRLTGRLKEIINRGGEKISPREVDEVLMDHPAVAQAVTFAIPHEKLGEEVGCALILKDGLTASESEIRDYVAKRLADFKVPRRVLFLEEIPKGPTGKLQRIGLAEKLGLA